MIPAFECILSEKAPLYRRILQVFVDAKCRYVTHLRLQDVVSGMGDLPEKLEDQEMESAVIQLCEWGNLRSRPDTSSVCTVEDFYNPRQTYQLTTQGEAFERAIALYHADSERDRQLQSGGLTDIRFVVQELKQLSQQAERNAAQIHRNMVLLVALFEDCLEGTQALIRQLDGRTDLSPPDVRRLVEVCRQVLAELELEGPAIVQAVRDIEHAGLERMILAMVRRNVDERKGVARPKAPSGDCRDWRLEWQRLRNWFISPPDRPSLQPGSALLRERLRSSLPALLRMSAGIQVEGTGRIDRIRDFRVLAKWFAAATSDAEAHVLWRAAFGLCRARHLIINDATLVEREAREIPANTSWVDAPPLRIANTEWRAAMRTDGLSRIIDRSAEKEKLSIAIQKDAQRLLNAQHPFGNGNRIRLSELPQLSAYDFELFLDLVGDAVSSRISGTEPVEILSGDGCLRVRLEPTGDDRQALLDTDDGIFSGPDLWIHIEQVATRNLPEVVS